MGDVDNVAPDTWKASIMSFALNYLLATLPVPLVVLLGGQFVHRYFGEKKTSQHIFHLAFVFLFRCVRHRGCGRANKSSFSF